MSGNGTSHYKLHGLVGWAMILTLPFVLCGAICAIPKGSQGFVQWLSDPLSALAFFIFFAATACYCKLEFDEVVMDYFDGGLRGFSLLANRIVAWLVTLAAFAAILQFHF